MIFIIRPQPLLYQMVCCLKQTRLQTLTTLFLSVDLDRVQSLFTDWLSLTSAVLDWFVFVCWIYLSIFFDHFFLLTITFWSCTQRIPKRLVPVIGVAPTGNASFVFGDFDVVTTSKYGPAGDDRMRFNDGWQKFAEACKLQEGMMAVILFHIIEGNLNISVDVIGNWSEALGSITLLCVSPSMLYFC